MKTHQPRSRLNGRSITLRSSISLLPVLLLAAMTGCTGPSQDGSARGGVTPPTDPQVVAVYNDGQVTRDEVDRAVLELPPPQRQQGTGAAAVDWFEGLTRELVVDRILATEAELLGARDDPEVRATFDEVRRQTVLEAFLERNLPAQEEPGEEEIRAFYEDHPERYDRPDRRRVLHLFKRRDPGTDLGQLKLEVADLRRRVLSGESFALLAAEYSESESRHVEGQLGWLTREQLPAELAEAIFSLAEGVPSEPLPTAEGVHLFLVEQKVEARRFPFEEVELMIGRQLAAERLQQAVNQLADGLPVPEGSFVAEREELAALLAAGDPQATVLEIGDFKLNAGRFLQLMSQNRQASAQPATPDLPFQFLQGTARRERIYRQALAQGVAEDPAVAERLASSERRALLRILRQRALQRKLSAEPERLQEYYDNNRLRFSSPLRLEVRHLKVPIAPVEAEANRQMASLERLASATTSDGSSLEAAATEMGGEIEELGWRTPGELARLDRRLAGLVAGLEAGELSAPFRSESFLEVLAVEDRREPEALPFASVLQQVEAAYLGDHGQELYREWLDATLDEAGLEIFSERLLEPAGGEPGSSGPSAADGA